MGSRRWTDDVRCPLAAALGPGALRCRLDDDTCLYGIFDTHNGTDAANFLLQRIAAEILLGSLDNKHSDEEIKEVLRNAFLSVEKAYIETLDVLIAERTSLQFELPEDLERDKGNKKYSTILDRLTRIDEKLAIGITAVIALIYNEKLYVANIGNSRALLCKTDDKCVLRVVQLSVDHSLTNEDELLRLSQLGLNINKLREADILGNQTSTRCLGNYLIKALYQAFPNLNEATSEPVIALPEVHGPINLDQSCRFLVLMSDELYKNLEDSIETEQVNKQLAQMIVEQFRVQPSLEAVCQKVVDKTTELFNEYCQNKSIAQKKVNRNTLLIRNFNFLLPNAVTKSPILPKKNINTNSAINHENRVRFNPIVQNHSPIATNNESDVDMYSDGQEVSSLDSHNDSNHGRDSSLTLSGQFSHNSDNSNSSSGYSPDSENKISTDKMEKVDAYVDFSQYYQNIEIARRNGTLPSNINFD